MKASKNGCKLQFQGTTMEIYMFGNRANMLDGDMLQLCMERVNTVVSRAWALKHNSQLWPALV